MQYNVNRHDLIAETIWHNHIYSMRKILIILPGLIF